MRKTDKKLDNQLRVALTDVCEIALKESNGFQWLTHIVNYSNFPESLKVVCVFDTNANLNSFMAQNRNHRLSTLIQKKLYDVAININNIADHISYDTEEECIKNDNGKWAVRLSE
jgi:hypothetical protein